MATYPTAQAKLMEARGYITQGQAAKLLLVSRGTVTNLCTADVLHWVDIGCHRYIELASLAASVGPTAAKLLGIANPKKRARKTAPTAQE